jgi:DNA (cytosine-5)-methyltransferase 1
MKLKLLDLFSGIGGFSLGLESTGFFETIGFVEKDKFCQKVLKKHWNNINIEEDIRNVKGERYAADIITGGFPCQPFSVAGKRKSTADDRYLWDEMLRVIREVKPIWIVAENVEGIVNINEGMVLRQVLNDLENEGFKSQCIIIPASGIGAWHQRKRIWIVSHSNSRLSTRENKEIQTRGNTITNGSEDVSNSKCNEHKHTTSREGRDDREWRFYSTQEEQTSHDLWSKTSRCDGVFGKDVPNTNSQRTQIQIKGEHPSIKMSGSSGEKTWWQTQSELCGVPNGVSYELDKGRSNRIKSLGNSIVPQIARQIGLAIMEAELNGKI